MLYRLARWLVALACAFPAPASSVLTNFLGTTSVGCPCPPDAAGAIGPSEFVEFVNTGMTVYSRTGSTVQTYSNSTFWNTKVGLSAGSSFSDPRIVYDPASGRWFAAEVTTSTSTNNNLLLGWSATSDPTGAWTGAKIASVSGTFADFPALGVTGNAVLLGDNDFSNSSASGVLQSITISSLNKSDLLSGTITRASTTLTTAGAAPQPALNLGTWNGANYVLTTGDQTQFGVLTLQQSGATLNSSFSAGTTDTSPLQTQPIKAEQPGGFKVETNDSRFSSNAYQLGDIIYMARTVGYAGRDAILWTVLDVSVGDFIYGLIDDPAYDYYFPSIAANSAGQVMLAFNRSGANAPDGYISSYAALGRFTGSGASMALDFGNPFLLQAGNTSDSTAGTRWGDYNTISVDPADSSNFWVVQLFAKSGFAYATQITEISAVPEPAAAALLLAGAGALVLLRRRRAR